MYGGPLSRDTSQGAMAHPPIVVTNSDPNRDADRRLSRTDDVTCTLHGGSFVGQVFPPHFVTVDECSVCVYVCVCVCVCGV